MGEIDAGLKGDEAEDEMGREAFVDAACAGRSGKVRALLEAEGIILRRPLGLTIARGSTRALTVDGGDLVGQADPGRFRLATRYRRR